MPQPIDSLLHRRPDLSTFLVHLTAATPGAEANLISILSRDVLEARNAYGLLRNLANDHQATNPALLDSQRVVCLTETPLEHVWMMCTDIENRSHPLAPYGIALSKVWARGVGVNPVWYVDELRTGHDWLTVPLMNLAKQARRVGGETYASPFAIDDGAAPSQIGLPIERSPIAALAPFIEAMGPVGPAGQERRHEFWWEREWRHRGDLSFELGLVAAFAPAGRHEHVRAALDQRGMLVPPLLDPTWGLERMISALANVDDRFAGPLPHY